MHISGVEIKFQGRTYYRKIYDVEELENGTRMGWILLPYRLVKEVKTLVIQDKGSMRWRVARER